jgi:hypothetical protein
MDRKGLRRDYYILVQVQSRMDGSTRPLSVLLVLAHACLSSTDPRGPVDSLAKKGSRLEGEGPVVLLSVSP